MTRYFYKDPLAAAWMAKHFGMKFYNLKEVIEGVEGETTLLALPQFVNDCRVGRRYFIQPDSLNLLLPKKGDVVSSDYEAWMIDSNGDRDWLGNLSIIQRNGLVFMWPESEAA